MVPIHFAFTFIVMNVQSIFLVLQQQYANNLIYLDVSILILF